MGSYPFDEKPGFRSSPHNRLEQNQVGEKPAHSLSLSSSGALVCVGMRESLPVNLEPFQTMCVGM